MNLVKQSHQCLLRPNSGEKVVVVKKRLAKLPLSAGLVVDKASTRPKSRAPSKSGVAGKSPMFSSVEMLMGYAYAMEAETSVRYAEFASTMESHNNLEVAELFRKLSRIEFEHGRQILESMNWTHAPTVPGQDWRWQGPELAETGDSGELHYLMHPYHALSMALENELRAQRFFEKVVRTATSTRVREVAAQLEREEAAHVQLVENWLKGTAVPDANWAEDADPPRNYD